MGLNIEKLFIACIILGALVFAFTRITYSPINKFTHDCVPNRNQQALDFLQKVYSQSPAFSDQKQRYCQAGYHPELSEKWETINRYTAYTAYATVLPLLVCTGAVQIYRILKQ